MIKNKRNKDCNTFPLSILYQKVQEFTSLDEVCFSSFSHTVSIRFNQGHSTGI